jgi:hypothetical protein
MTRRGPEALLVVVLTFAAGGLFAAAAAQCRIQGGFTEWE